MTLDVLRMCRDVQQSFLFNGACKTSMINVVVKPDPCCLRTDAVDPAGEQKPLLIVLAWLGFAGFRKPWLTSSCHGMVVKPKNNPVPQRRQPRSRVCCSDIAIGTCWAQGGSVPHNSSLHPVGKSFQGSPRSIIMWSLRCVLGDLSSIICGDFSEDRHPAPTPHLCAVDVLTMSTFLTWEQRPPLRWPFGISWLKIPPPPRDVVGLQAGSGSGRETGVGRGPAEQGRRAAVGWRWGRPCGCPATKLGCCTERLLAGWPRQLLVLGCTEFPTSCMSCSRSVDLTTLTIEFRTPATSQRCSSRLTLTRSRPVEAVSTAWLTRLSQTKVRMEPWRAYTRCQRRHGASGQYDSNN